MLVTTPSSTLEPTAYQVSTPMYGVSAMPPVRPALAELTAQHNPSASTATRYRIRSGTRRLTKATKIPCAPVARVRLLILTGLILVPAALAAAAGASTTQQSAVYDNRLLLEDTPQLDLSLLILRRMGVERVQADLDWAALAPSSRSRRAPRGFDASNPAAYPAAIWAPYDRLVTEARRYGLGVTFEIGGPAPRWATGRSPSPERLANVWYPSASRFGAFVAAVSARYDGNYVPAPGAVPLPAVDTWSVWEQPNSGGSLAPQVVKGVEVAPSIYRALAGAAYRALRSDGHRRDTILVGGLDASGQPHPGAAGSTDPLRFVRALFCVDARGSRLQGKPATLRGCP